jgi:hypothetical protein
MKLISNRIMTRKVSLEDAIKAKDQKAEPTMKEVLEKVAKQGKDVKVASPETSKEAKKPETPTVEVKVDQKLQKEAGEPFGGKKAPPFGSEERKELKEKGEVEVADDKKDDKKDDEKGDKKDDKKDDKKEEKACVSSGKKTLKVAKQIDFRNWEAEDVVKAWGQHGSLENCVKNVAKETDDPKTYCGLLQVASQVAGEIIVKKAKAKKPEKKATSEKQPKGAWKKLAKLTEKEKSMLEQYWRKLYGDKYVDSLLADY